MNAKRILELAEAYGLACYMDGYYTDDALTMRRGGYKIRTEPARIWAELEREVEGCVLEQRF